MRRIWRVLVSMRTTAALLAALAALLVVNVAVPQAALDPDRYAEAVASGRVRRFLLETVQLGHVATSVPFIAMLGAFFANLAAVLVDRTGATLRRVRLAPPTEAQARALLAALDALELPAAPGGDRVAAVLSELGYETTRTAGGAVWGVKHRLALLGFPLFHASFFLLCAAGVQLYLTRDVGTLVVAEGMEGTSQEAAVVRRAPLGAPPPVTLALERVDVALERGSPTRLAATVRIDGAGPQEARVNAPARRGPLTVLVERAGIAPVLWLTDTRGFTLDRVLAPVATPSGFATRVPLPGGLEVAIEPIPVGEDFPERPALADVPLAVRVREGDREVFHGALRPGESLALDGRALRIQEVRYWAGFRLVRERGGGALVAGFALGIAGIAWRMLLFRREVVVGVHDGRPRVGGRGEFFPARFRDELELVRDLLARGDRASERTVG